VKKESILITGGTGKLGKVFATHFAKKNMQVLISTTNLDKAIEFKKSFPEGKNVEFFLSDLCKKDAPKKLIEDISNKGFIINHLVNNARSLKSLKIGINGNSHREDMTNEYLLSVIVPYELSIEIYSIQKNKIYTITNIGSQYGSVAANPALYGGNLNESPIQYGLAKASLHHLTKELAIRLSKDNIRVNCIAFGGVKGRVNPIFEKRYSDLVPIGRMLEENEVIGPLEFLISESSSSITGHILAADGGWTIW